MLKIHARKLGTVAVLCLRGRIVKGETAPLREAMDSQSDASVVILDLARISTIDAGGLGAMLELRELARSKGIDFKLMNVTKLVSRVLEVTRLNSVFEVTSGAEVFVRANVGRPASAVAIASCA